MPRKTAGRNPRPTTIGLYTRLQKELQAGHYPQALELARLFHSQQPGDASLAALKDALVGQIHQFLRSDRLVEARRHLDEAEKLESRLPDWLEQLSVLRARSGDWAGAIRLLDRVPGTLERPKALAQLVDRALREPKNGKSLLPADLHAGFDAIVSAFAHHERGQDEQARATLQSIGMQSPFLDWKLLLRGLMAYSATDDARAIENWQRLDAGRLPAQLAAPLRFQIDAAFRGALTPEQMKRFGNRSDHLALPMLASLRKIQLLLSSPDHLPDALRQVRPLIGMLKMNAPQYLPKLANCFYWLIILGGQPDDMEEYEAIFGKPADDPNFCRLIAFVMESAGRLEEAHKEWRQHSDWIASQPQRWPGEFGKRARAMIALRMGDNAIEHDNISDDPTPENFLDFLRRELHRPGKRKPLKPTAEACYRNALELAPDWKEPLARLLDYYIDEQQWEKAEAIGRRFAERFPDNPHALVRLSDVLHAQAKDAEALEVLRTALKHNPLDSELRGVVAQLTLRRGRQQTASGDYEAARASFQESLNLDPQFVAPATRASLAACEFKAGNEETARRHASELQAAPQKRVAAVFLLMAETSRVKAGKAIQAEFKSQFEDALKGDIDFLEFLQLLIAWNLYRSEDDRFHGFGTHEKKILARVQQIVESKLPEEDLARFGMFLVEMRLHKPLKILAEQGCGRFQNNPAFSFLMAQQMILQRPRSFDLYRVGATFAHVLERIGSNDVALSAAMREMIDRCCDEHPRLREIVDQQLELRRALPRSNNRRGT